MTYIIFKASPPFTLPSPLISRLCRNQKNAVIPAKAGIQVFEIVEV
jgi:hypothetical protein